MTRRELDWYDLPPAPIPGAAHGVSSDGDDGELAGRLLVPDPEQRHGWREVYVRRPSPQRRPIGFQRPGPRR